VGDIVKHAILRIFSYAAGTGKITTVSTCYAETKFLTELIVLEVCDNKGVCQSNIDPGFPIPCPYAYGKTFTFEAKLSQRYRIMVYSPNAQITGDYGIKVVDYPPPANDVCTSAHGLQTDGTQRDGSTINATIDTVSCGASSIGGRGVWCKCTFAFSSTVRFLPGS
jgi:hypothetical protein